MLIASTSICWHDGKWGRMVGNGNKGMAWEYGVEELLPVVEKLTGQYTSRESSSVTYEAAQTLMEAVVYSIDACTWDGGDGMVRGAGKPDVWEVYGRGRDVILEKVYEVKRQYEDVLDDFKDYGCKNYGEVVREGLPRFFARYDPQFVPQDHLLTLDYPLVMGIPEGCGVKLMGKYMAGVQMEKRLLDCFDERFVRGLLEKTLPDYQSLYLDNLCHPVLLNTVGCLIAEKPVGRGGLEVADYVEVAGYFEGCDVEKVTSNVRGVIRMVVGRLLDENAAAYFEGAANDYAVRMVNGISNHSLERVIP